MSSKKINRKNLVKNFIQIFSLLSFFLLIGLSIYLYIYINPKYQKAQSFDLSKIKNISLASTIYDSDNEKLGLLFIKENRNYIDISNVSKNFISALLASEDSRFYKHKGVDYFGILRAIYQAIINRKFNQGASTITQQLSRQSFNLKEKTIDRKIIEIFLAYRIEKSYSKKDILNLYINKIYFGSGYYGILTAARGFFGKHPKNLSLSESASLVAAIPNPLNRSPRYKPDTSIYWRNFVIRRMQKEKVLSKNVADIVTQEPINTIPKSKITGETTDIYDEVKEKVITILGKKRVLEGGLKIYTTINKKIQTYSLGVLQKKLAEIESLPNYKHSTLKEFKYKKSKSKKTLIPEYLQGAIFMIENKTGKIISKVSSRDFNDSMFDRIKSGKMTTGTAFTPFVYAAAFQNLNYHPGTLVKDTHMDTRQVMIGGLTGVLGEWGSEILNNTYEGEISSRVALAKSKNSATVRVGQKVGLSNFIKFIKSLGLSISNEEKIYNSSFLGKIPISPEEFCIAFSAFPNSGKIPQETFMISSIKDNNGKEIYSHKIKPLSPTKMDKYTAYQITSILQDSFNIGTAKKAKKYNIGNYDVAGKTGTEYLYTDNWFIGFTSEVTCAIWIGFDQKDTGKAIYERAFSSDTVLPIWTSIMNLTSKKFVPSPFISPETAHKKEICSLSGKLASDNCYKITKISEKLTSQINLSSVEYLRPNSYSKNICHIHNPDSNPIYIVKPAGITNYGANPVIPTSPTLINEQDTYRSIKPSISKNSNESKSNNNGIIIKDNNFNENKNL